jgi:small subunit ribosomal protein S6
MKSKKYELMIIMDPDFEGIKLLGDVKDLMGEYEVEVSSQDEWGLRTLAYPINKKGQGRYIVFQVILNNPDRIKDFSRELLIKDGIMRSNLLSL